MTLSSRTAMLVVLAAGLAIVATAASDDFGPWSAAVNVETIPGTDPSFNTPFGDGCPTLARDGRTLFMASNRPGGLGGQDIWVATRTSADGPWGAPINVGPPVNTSADDFCPSPARDGHLFFYVSRTAGGCGGSDIYVTRWRSDQQGWEQPVNVGCQVNSEADEASPFLIEEPGLGPVLYFSSNRVGGYAPDSPGTTPDDDIYLSEWHGGIFEPAVLVPMVNTASHDSRPNVRRDALELFLDSNRAGTLGASDIFSSTRPSPLNSWSIPQPLGPLVNSALVETRPSLSWDGTTLVFGSTRPGGEGGLDIYMTRREKVR